MELVSLLEKNDPNVKINLILLEGLPKNLQARLSSLGLFGSPEFFNNLYEICFGNLKVRFTRLCISTCGVLEKERTSSIYTNKSWVKLHPK